MNEDWLDVSFQFSTVSSQEPGTVEVNIMQLLLNKIERLLSITHRHPNRICTLHRIMGDRVIFYMSTRRQPPGVDRQVDSISEGLIGQAIEERNDVTFFKNANQLPGYIPGWDRCKSELIGLIKDATGRPIGVVNIESDISDDFLCDDNPNIDPQRDILRQQLEQLVRIACGYLLLISKNQALIQERNSSSHLIEALSVNPISTLYPVSNSTFVWLAGRTELLSAVFYVTDFENENQYIKIASHERIKSLPDKIIPDSQSIKSLFSPGYHNVTRNKVIRIFGKEFSEKFINEAGEAKIYFEASNVPDLPQGMSMRYFIGIVVAQRDGIDHVRTCFEVLKKTVTRYLQNEVNQATHLLSEITIDMYEKALQEGNSRTLLNYIATNISNTTSAQFCLIYLVAPDEYYYSKHKIYLGGAGSGEVNFAHIRFSRNVTLVEHVIQGNKSYYHDNFYDCPLNAHSLDHLLKEKGLKKPEVFAFPLFQKESSITIGALVLLRENSNIVDTSNKPKVGQVKMMLSEWSNHLSSIIYNENQKQADSILAETYVKLIELFIPTIPNSSDYYVISDIQKKIAKKILPLWGEILNPAFFVVYKKVGENFELLDASVLPRMSDTRPPVFQVGQGLTGSVIQMERKELYEPFVEDIGDHNRNMNDSNYSADVICRNFWDSVSGSRSRMYYGRYVIIGGNEYVLLIVGVRGSKFLPPLGYKLSRDFIDTIYRYLKAIIPE
jgi:hypothetical protein